MKSLSVAILAGGLGTRLRETVPDKQKVVAEVAGSPFLRIILKQLATAGCEEVVLCTGYKSEQVEQQLGQSAFGMRLIYSPEPSPRGTAGALAYALSHYRHDQLLVLNGDSFCDVDLTEVYAKHVSNLHPATVVSVFLPDTSRFGRLDFGPDGRINAFREKGVSGPGFINSGIYFLTKELYSTLSAEQPNSLEKDVFPVWVDQGKMYCYKAEGRRFIDIGTPDSFAEAQEFFTKLDST